MPLSAEKDGSAFKVLTHPGPLDPRQKTRRQWFQAHAAGSLAFRLDEDHAGDQDPAGNRAWGPTTAPDQKIQQRELGTHVETLERRAFERRALQQRETELSQAQVTNLGKKELGSMKGPKCPGFEAHRTR